MLAKFLFRVFPALIIGIVFVFINYKSLTKENVKIILFLLFGVFGFSLQFLFAPFPHYYLYMIPFASVFVFYVTGLIKKYKLIYLTFLFITFGFSFYSTYNNRVNKIYIKNSCIKRNQYFVCEKLKELIAPGKTLYVADVGLIEQYYLTNFMPPNFKKYGYSFGPGLDKNSHLDQIKSADYILKFKKDYFDFDLKSELSEKELKSKKCITITNDILLFY